jgi:hypothetical protein
LIVIFAQAESRSLKIDGDARFRRIGPVGDFYRFHQDEWVDASHAKRRFQAIFVLRPASDAIAGLLLTKLSVSNFFG